MNTIIRCTVSADGNKDWLLDVAVPLSEELEKAEKEGNHFAYTDNLPEIMQEERLIQASGGLLIAGVVGMLTFLATRLATKVLDDVYELKIQPIIRKALGSADAKLSGSNATHKKILQLGYFYEDVQVLVLIAIVGDTFSEIIDVEAEAKSAHNQSVEWLNDNDTTQKVLLSILNVEGQQITPLVFDNIKQAKKHLNSLEIFERKPPT